MKQKSQKSLEELEPEVGQDFTGVARSVEAFNNQGFRNFRIVNLFIEKGRVMRQEYSDPYATFELIIKMELQNELSIHSLNNKWEEGKALFK